MQRLLDLLQILRNHRLPVAGAQLATELGVSLRTLYRDINALREQGAQIDGDPGLGFILRPGFLLPPLMFSEEEIEALVLGSHWVAERGDAPLSAAARNALSKIAAVLPRHLRPTLDFSALLVGDTQSRAKVHADVAEISPTARDADLPQLRKAIRAEISYRGFTRSQIVILDALLKLRQVCCDPRLVKSAVARKVKEKAKLDLLMDMLPEMVEEGRRILVFSQFTAMLDLIKPSWKPQVCNI
jgi:biotin operon repressor